MLCIPIVGPTFFDVQNQLQKALSLGKLIEFRLDLFEEDALKNLALFRKEVSLPVIFTLRKKEQGGHFEGSEKKRQAKIREYAQHKPDYFDLEFDLPKDFAQSFQRDFPKIKVIISFHDFLKTPPLEEVLKTLKTHRASLYKIACMAESTNDSLRMLDFVHKNRPLLGMCMGEKGEITRILGSLFGSPWIYASLSEEEKSANGQITADTLLSVYKIERLTEKSSLYGLIGNPLNKSIGKIVHNQVFEDLELNAVYINMVLEKEELQDFFSLAKKLGFKGLSVTIPLKEEVLPFLDSVEKKAQEIGAVNTLLLKEDGIFGTNTDGKGALDAIEQKLSVQNKKVAILGAGGAARAIAYEAIQRKAHVLILNRTRKRAHLLAKSLGVRGEGLDFLNTECDYDILINTTPDELPIDPKFIRPKSLVMDITTIPKMGALLKHAYEKKCILVYGYEMWINQAVRQYDVWFSSQFDKNRIRNILEKKVLMQVI